ncbi:HNH endonuclease, partial [Gordonia terrae]
GQYTTRIERSGPDEGRCLWRLNAEPGAPPNPERINRRPDIPRRFAEHLNTVRDEIHGPPTRPGDQPRPDLSRADAVGYGDSGRRLELAYRELVHPRTLPEDLITRPLTPVEAELARILTDHV